eukprot:CAMPEP_0181293086 /NCGR_PEP_ID=MMETSP1101-20121128/2872_1 /TAXON_ID=46948 /ORGANISM="Rhodomonas abbreviata, Strain Caron Lab Isolate" /LENGTH=367 /DNA_ID=CAMNT_0023397639 /DNA_START=20 /DNA_END=1123 /DNA_ORIENTATION=+
MGRGSQLLAFNREGKGVDDTVQTGEEFAEDASFDEPLLSSKVEGAPSWQSLKAVPRKGLYDLFSVAVVAGQLVPCFTVFPMLILLVPAYMVSTYGVLSLLPFFTLLAISLALPPLYSPFFKKSIFRTPLLELLNYVRPFEITKQCPLPKDKTYIMCWHPHGRLFYGFAVFCGLFDVWFPELNGREFFGGINDAMFAIPVLSNLLYLTGMTPCNRKEVDRRLKAKQHVGLIIGGIEEVLEGTFDTKDVLFLKNRKGFAKIAMDHGAGLVPVYAFGENQLFQHEPKWRLDFWRWINKFVKVGAPLPILGVWGFPVPFRRELLIAVGEPLFAEENETLDEFHARYVSAVETLFRQNVMRTTRPNHELVVV